MKGYIYILIDPITKDVRYVGQTEDIIKRGKYHWLERTQGKTKLNHKSHWIRKLWREHQVKPEIMAIEIVDESTMEELEMRLNERELYWINLYIAKGCDLTNTSHKFFNRIVNHHLIKRVAPHAKPVYQYDPSCKMVVYRSMHYAAYILDESFKNISRICSGRRNTLRNQYVLSYQKLTKDQIKLRFDKSYKINKEIIAVGNDGTEIRFKNQTAAAIAHGLKIQHINKAIKRKRECAGFKWRYA